MPKAKQTKQVKKSSSGLSTRTVVVCSVALNIILIVGIVVTVALVKSGATDAAIVNYGVDRYCNSDRFQKEVLKDDSKAVASRNFYCGRGSAKPFLERGMSDYYKSIGIETADQNTDQSTP